MPEAPLDIRRFETAQLVLLFVGLMSSLIIDRAIIDHFGISIVIGKIAGLILLVGLTLLVTRGRKNWARWILLAIYVLGALTEIWMFRIVLASGYPTIAIASILLRGAVLIWAFTPQSTEWLRRSPRAV